MQIELNKEEAQAVFQLIDLAVKAGGVQVAASALHIVKKLEDAAKADAQTAQKAGD